VRIAQHAPGFDARWNNGARRLFGRAIGLGWRCLRDGRFGPVESGDCPVDGVELIQQFPSLLTEHPYYPIQCDHSYLDFTLALHFCQDPRMILGVSPTKDAVVIAHATGSGEMFVIKSIAHIQFQARSGDDLTELLQRLVVVFGRGGRSRRSKIALLGSSSGRFKSSVEAIKAEAITELAAAESGLPVVKVTAASLKKALGCAVGQKWQARAGERFNRTGRHKNWSHGAAGAAAAALKVAGETR
jgi:hypothetical protein